MLENLFYVALFFNGNSIRQLVPIIVSIRFLRDVKMGLLFIMLAAFSTTATDRQTMDAETAAG